MKIVVIKPPKLIAGMLRLAFGIKKCENRAWQ